MRIKTLKSIARRGVMLGAAFAVVAASIAPASLTFADALNPLTDRSLTLSSSSPGWDFKDGSGNSTYAPANSGANGQKTGNTFAFKVSSDTSANTLFGMTFQYCTTSAGTCIAPGNITGHGPNDATAIAAKQSDLEIVTATPTEVGSGAFGTYIDTTTGAIKAIPTSSNFVVYYQSAGTGTLTTADDTWTQSTGWVMTASEAQSGTSNGKPNQINLVHGTGASGTGTGFAAGTPVKVQFFATDTNYITNPGAGAFFVKINTYSAVDNTDDTAPVYDLADVIDGGVTVANVMNLSIQITTKVLETMEFSVGTVDPNTLSSGAASQLATATATPGRLHTPCDRILMGMNPADSPNVLKMGNPDGEFSLETTKTYSTHSYWRLSSNSSAGATVYYSGNTLSNTVGDKIKAIGDTKALPVEGSEQFGLAISNVSHSTAAPVTVGPVTTGYQTKYETEALGSNIFEYGADDSAAGLVALRADQVANPTTYTANGIHSSVGTDVGSNPSYHVSQLYPLKAEANYDQGAGNNNTEYGTINAQYAFDETSQQIPVAIATEDAQVVDCVTAKMRYIGNIAATTPAGIYTTKINYIAAPQY